MKRLASTTFAAEAEDGSKSLKSPGALKSSLKPLKEGHATQNDTVSSARSFRNPVIPFDVWMVRLLRENRALFVFWRRRQMDELRRGLPAGTGRMVKVAALHHIVGEMIRSSGLSLTVRAADRYGRWWVWDFKVFE